MNLVKNQTGVNKIKSKCIEIGKQLVQVSRGHLEMTMDEHNKFLNKTPSLAIATKNSFSHGVLRYEIKLSVANNDRYSVEANVENLRKLTGVTMLDFERDSLAMGVYNLNKYDKLFRHRATVDQSHSNKFAVEWNDTRLTWLVNDSPVETYDYGGASEIGQGTRDLLNEQLELVVLVSPQSNLEQSNANDSVTVSIDYVRVYNYTEDQSLVEEIASDESISPMDQTTSSSSNLTSVSESVLSSCNHLTASVIIPLLLLTNLFLF